MTLCKHTVAHLIILRPQLSFPFIIVCYYNVRERINKNIIISSNLKVILSNQLCRTQRFALYIVGVGGLINLF